jgi:hypothetical protein
MPLNLNAPKRLIVKDPAQSLFQRCMMRLRGPNYCVQTENNEVVGFYAFSDQQAVFLGQRIATFESYTFRHWAEDSFTITHGYVGHPNRVKVARGYVNRNWMRTFSLVTFYSVHPHHHKTNGVITTSRVWAWLVLMGWSYKLWYLALRYGMDRLDRMQTIINNYNTVDPEYLNRQITDLRRRADKLANGATLTSFAQSTDDVKE